MDKFQALLPIAAAAGLLYAAHKWGNGMVKGAAYGVAGYMVANQIPVVRDGLQTRLVA